MGCNSFPEVIALCQDVVVEDLVVKKKDNNKQASTKPSSKEKNTANNKANVAKNSSTFIQASDNESSAIPAISVSQANINRSESDISNNNEEDIPDLLSFDGEVLFQGNLLQWYTPREQDNDFFNIFHSIDGRQFELIRSIPSRGNANNVTPYDMVHRMASKGTNYYYITQTHKDGDVSKVSNTMNVSRVDDDMTLLNIASNKGNLHVVYIIPQTGDANLNIYDEAGKLLKEDVLKATKEDYNRARLDISGLATGTYYLQLAQQGQDISTKFFIR
ncbi:MAG: T9SS type A sorting domain-containing protein [Chitinophagales bacterium]